MIRDFKPSDLETLITLWYQENLTAHSFIKQEYWQKKYYSVKTAIKSAKVYVYEKNDEIRGFIGTTGNYIAGLFVNKDFQNKGIGRKLLNKVKSNVSDIYLNVYVKNSKAVKFYRKNGFRIVDTHRDSETRKKEHVMFWKRLILQRKKKLKRVKFGNKPFITEKQRIMKHKVYC